MGTPSVRSNIVSMMFWQLGNYIVPLLTFPYLTRVLGVSNFGMYALSFAVVTYLVLVTDWGFPLTASAKIARANNDSDVITHIFWTTLCAKLLLGVLMLVCLLLILLFVPPVRVIGVVLLCASATVVANILTVSWCLQGLEQLGKFAIAATLGRALTVPAMFLCVHNSGDAWIAALVQSGGAMIGGVLSIFMVMRFKIIGPPRTSCRSIVNELRDAWPLFVSAISVNLYTTTNLVLLGVLHGPAQVGIFSGADRLRAAAQSAITPISQAVYPRASRKMQNDPADAYRFARKLLLFQGLFTLCITLILEIGAKPIVHLMAGQKFDGSILILQILAPIPFLVGLSNVFGVQLMLPLGMKTLFSRILIAAALTDLVTVVPLAWFYGALGTALATLIAEFLVVVSMFVVLLRMDIPIFSERVSASKS